MNVAVNVSLTVGIPTYNEEKSIGRCIKACLRQISFDDEIIVVASGCTDRTCEEVRMIKDDRVKLIEEENRNGKASAINLIIQNAKNDIIIQTDGDVMIGKGAISYLLKHFEDKNIGAVSGNPIPILPEDNLFYEWTHMSYRKAGELREKESKDRKFWHLCGYLLAFRKEAIKEVPFVKGAVDAWMGKIIKENGYKIVYEPRAKVHVKAPLNIKDFLAQKARVRAGFLLMPKGPRTFKKEIMWLPVELFKVSIWKWHKFIFSGFIYLYSWMKGLYFAKTNKSLKEIWKTPESTK